MSDASLDHQGPALPPHRYGHCGYDPSMNGSQMCDAPATLHLWIGGQDSPDAWAVETCPAHESVARSWLNVLDWHPIAAECLVPDDRRRWHFTGVPGRSFCIDTDDNPQAELEALERVAGQTG